MKLYYFDIPGRAVVVRLLLHVGKIPFEDKRHTREDWAALKPKMPLGQVPVLEMDDGEMVVDSTSIAEYVADKMGITPACPRKALWVRSIMAGIWDAGSAARKLYMAKSEEERKAVCPEVNAEVKNGFAKLDKYVAKREKDGYVLGDDKKNTMADYAIYAVLKTKPPMPDLDLKAVFTEANCPTLCRIVARLHKEIGDDVKKNLKDFADM